jgi:hypothetical protein
MILAVIGKAIEVIKQRVNIKDKGVRFLLELKAKYQLKSSLTTYRIPVAQSE